MDDLSEFLARAERVLDRLEALLPEPIPSAPDWACHAFRWRRSGARGFLQGIPQVQPLRWEDLLGLDPQKEALLANTQQFLAGAPANNALLWGARGTGKSSLIKALFHRFRAAGLRLIEVEKADLLALPDILEPIRARPERFLLFCDDLSFDAGESQYKALKAALEGSLSEVPENLLIYATSNRRHLLPEFQGENREARVIEGEIHPGESIEEKISLSDRFGLWIAFHPFDQAQYLAIVRHWLNRFGVREDSERMERAALRWALRRGSRSGRTAWQFARDWAGRAQI